MNKEDLYIYSNIFVIDDVSIQTETITKSIFNIEVKGGSQTEKEILDCLKKEHPSLNLAETVFGNPAVYIEATKEYYGNDYKGSDLYYANFTVMVESPVKCPVAVYRDFEFIAKTLEDAMSDYEKENYHQLPKKYIKIKAINIEFVDNYETLTDNIIFKPQPDGLIQKITVCDVVDKTIPETITPAEMETEIQAALQDNANITVDGADPYPPVPYDKWEAKIKNNSIEK